MESLLQRRQLLSAFQIVYGHDLKSFKRECLDTFFLKITNFKGIKITNSKHAEIPLCPPPGYRNLGFYKFLYRCPVGSIEAWELCDLEHGLDYNSKCNWLHQFGVNKGELKRINFYDYSTEHKNTKIFGLKPINLITFNNICVWLYSIEYSDNFKSISKKIYSEHEEKWSKIVHTIFNYELYDEDYVWYLLENAKNKFIEDFENEFSYDFIFFLICIYPLAFFGDDMYTYISQYVVEFYCEVFDVMENRYLKYKKLLENESMLANNNGNFTNNHYTGYIDNYSFDCKIRFFENLDSNYKQKYKSKKRMKRIFI